MRSSDFGWFFLLHLAVQIWLPPGRTHLELRLALGSGSNYSHHPPIWYYCGAERNGQTPNTGDVALAAKEKGPSQTRRNHVWEKIQPKKCAILFRKFC
ncbi:hypothetical protein B0H19DRAFT_1192771, partial [Mycena capillaripes]